jgi:zinc protease
MVNLRKGLWLSIPLTLPSIICSGALSHAARAGSNGEAGVTATTAIQGEMPQVAFEKYTLPNGLQVILHVDRKLPVVHVNQWFHVGSKNERTGRTGFAHLFEHLMFQGSKNCPGEYFSLVETAGANLREGGVNGTTSFDRTNYFATVPSGNLETLLWIESDRLATLVDAMTQEKLDNQRDVVKNERREGLENTPYGRWLMLLMENLHPAGHPYAHDVIGSHEDLTAASLEDVKDFFRTYYTPNNLSLAITGDFEPEETKRLIEKYFGPIPPGPALARPGPRIPRMDGERVIEVNDRVPQERVYMVWPAPEYFGAGEAELNLASLILSDGLSSRLDKTLVYDQQLCTEVSSFNWSFEISGAVIVIATARPGASLDRIEEIITEEIGRLSETAPTEAELDRAKSKLEYAFVSGLERIGGFGGKADLLNQYNVYLGDPGGFEADVNRHRGVSPSDVQSATDRWLNNRNRLLIRFHPEPSQRESLVELDRSIQPPLGADRPFLAPEVQSTTLENGLEVFVVERPELPKVAVGLATRAGNVADPVGREGVAYLTTQTIDLGTKTRRALEIEDALGDLGTSLGANTTREFSALSFEVLTRNLEGALTLFSDVVRNPAFPESEVEREKALLLDDLAQEANEPWSLAARIRSIIRFGPEHPYGRPQRGLPSTVEQIQREDIVAFHRAHWQPQVASLIIAGDITLERAVDLARKALGDWQSGSAAAIPIPPPAPMAPGKIYMVDRQDAAQTMIAQVLPAPERKSEDYYALSLADAVWGGGGFGTRLNLNLREDKGYTYGVFSFLHLYTAAGLWAAQGGVDTDKTSESVTEFITELKALTGERPISEEELADAKVKRVRGYSQQFETLGQVGEQIAWLWAAELPMSELRRETEEVEKTSLEAVNAAARKYSLPGQSSLLLVGDRSKIEEGVRELNLGEIVILDEEGKLIAAESVAGDS